MDTQEILTSLTALRDNLSAIESARQQVERNVAAYDRVKQQLAETAVNINKILTDFTSISEAVKTHEKSVEKSIDASKKEILKGLKDKATSISKESSLLIDGLKTTLESLKFEMDNATNEAIQRIHETAGLAKNDVTGELQGIIESFSTSVNSTITNLKKEITRFNNEISKVSEKFDTSLTSQLSRLSTSVSQHISKYESLEQSLSAEIQKLNSENETLSKIIANLETRLGQKVDELLPKISCLFDEIKNLTSDIRGDIRTQTSDVVLEVQKVAPAVNSDIKKSVSEIKSDIKTTQDSNKKRIDKLESKLASEISSLNTALQKQINESKSKSIRTTIVCFILLAIPILLILFKLTNHFKHLI